MTDPDLQAAREEALRLIAAKYEAAIAPRLPERR